MPTCKVSEREKLTIFARTATDDELEEAYEIFGIERRVRAANKKPPVNQTRTRQSNKTKDETAKKGTAADAVPGNGASETGA
jgi:hypothetical protein